LKTIPAGSQWPHSMTNCRRQMKLSVDPMRQPYRRQARGGQPAKIEALCKIEAL
jgi:hypothetical protein